MTVEHAFQIVERYEIREHARGRSFDFAVTFSQLGRNLRKTESSEEIFLGSAWACFPTGTGKHGIAQGVLVCCSPHMHFFHMQVASREPPQHEARVVGKNARDVGRYIVDELN